METLTSKQEVDEIIRNTLDKVLILRFGRASDHICMQLDEILEKTEREVSRFASIALVDVDAEEVQVYVKYFDITLIPATIFFFNAHHMKMDSGTPDHTKWIGAFHSKQDFIDVVETIYRGAMRGKMIGFGMKRLRGGAHFRQRLVLSTLAGTPLRIDDIRAKDDEPGLQAHEATLLRLLENISNGCVVEINETGTKLRYKPGILTGGSGIVHDCGTSRAIGYFLEPLLILGLFGKKPLTITLRGITNDCKDPSVDTFRITTLPMLKHFGVPIEDLELKIISRGAPPTGGGEVRLKVPIVPNALTAVNWVDEGMVKRVRGVAYSTRLSPQMANRMIDAARGILNRLLPDVYIFTDHYKGGESGKSPGYGISLVAETTTGCLISGEDAAQDSMLPEDIGSKAAMCLLEEIKKGGVVDSTHQGLLFMLSALCPEDVSKIRVGKLSHYGIGTLRNIKEILGVEFNIKPDAATDTLILTCVGSGFRNLSRKIA